MGGQFLLDTKTKDEVPARVFVLFLSNEEGINPCYLDIKLTIFIKQITIDADLTVLTDIADHIPVDG